MEPEVDVVVVVLPPPHAPNNAEDNSNAPWTSFAFIERMIMLLYLDSNGEKERVVLGRERQLMLRNNIRMSIPYRGPATIVSLRPVTLRPYLSISLPSERRLVGDKYQVKF
jgi:hypothetical protein